MTTPPQPPIAPGPAAQRHDHPHGEGPPPTAPRRKAHWWRDAGKGGKIAIVGAAALVPLLALLFVAGEAGWKIGGAPDSVTVDVSSCTFQDGETLPSVTTEFTATNTGRSDESITIEWEFRDSSGARVDTDTTRVTVPAGDTIRDSETTLLPVAASGGTCGYSLS